VRSRRALGAVAIVVVAIFPGSAAGAATSVEAGWWTTSPMAAAPDAPPDALVMQGGSGLDNPFAYAAVGYALSSGETPTRVKLTVSPNSASTPNSTLTVCPLTEPFTPAQGGASGEAPAYDCGTKATSAPSDDGNTYTFDVAALARGGALSLAILPSASTDRVVIARPQLESLESTSAGGAGTAIAEFTPSTESGTGPTTFGPTGPASGSFDVPSPPAPNVPGPAVGADTSREGRDQALPVASPITTASSDDGSAVPAFVLVGLVLLAAALWLSAGSLAGAAEPAEETIDP
jgi:hypothetical protein